MFEIVTRIERRLAHVESLLQTSLRVSALILRFQGKTMSALSDLQAAVTAQGTVIDSAVTLLQAIPGMITDAGTDAAALGALQADIAAHTQSLAAAIVAGTPAAPAPADPAAPV